MAFQGVSILLCVGADREELERFEDAGFTVQAWEAATAATPAVLGSVDASVEASLVMPAAAVESSVEATVSSDARGAVIPQDLEESIEAEAMAALGIDASVEISTRLTDNSVATDDGAASSGDAAGADHAEGQEDEDDDALLARMLGAPLSHGNDDGDGGFGEAADALSISVDASVDVAADEEEWIE